VETVSLTADEWAVVLDALQLASNELSVTAARIEASGLRSVAKMFCEQADDAYDVEHAITRQLNKER
jgi:vacuolar-type H+-ATPase subunit B/Vma2